MEEIENETIDELGFVVGVFEREFDQLQVTAPKTKASYFRRYQNDYREFGADVFSQPIGCPVCFQANQATERQ